MTKVFIVIKSFASFESLFFFNLLSNKCAISDLTTSPQTLEPGAYPSFTSLSPPEQTTPVQPRNPELEQRAKAMRGRMWVLPLLHQFPSFPTTAAMLSLFPLRFVLNELIQTEKDYVKDLGIVVEVRNRHTPQNETKPHCYSHAVSKFKINKGYNNR